MKRIISILLALTLIFIFNACVNENQSELDATPTIPASTSNADSTDTSTNKNTNTEDINPDHTHAYVVEATCTEPKKCSCGATDGSALGHNYKNFICTRCNAQQQGAFVDLKEYFWKFGEEIVNLNVPGKESLAPYTLELKLFDFYIGFINNSSCVAWTDTTVADMSSVYNAPNIDVCGRIYNSKVYSMMAETYCDFTFEDEGSCVKITFKGKYAGNTITFEKKGTDELVVTANTCSALESISVGSVFKAYPRWEIFNGA